ncbi:hypothetical protein B566_EDAN002380, partial [Ephemera danica]
MGPSGAGKTTLLNLLSGFLVPIKYYYTEMYTSVLPDMNCILLRSKGMEGEICTNGVPRDMAVFRKNSCYILQSDQLHPLFTVSEVLHMAASLKLGPGTSSKSRSIAVHNVLEALGLVSCRNTRAAMLSGGQQKRLSIALELLDNPPVMFLDEPTTGLDSSASFSCVELLTRLARGGRTVICTLHQPSARMFETLDHVYLLSRGRCGFQGDSRLAVSFLDVATGLKCPRYHNPADFMLDVASGEEGDVTEKLERASSSDQWRRVTPRVAPIVPMASSVIVNETRNVLFRAHKHGVSEWSKFCVLLRRSFLMHSRNWTTTHLKISLHTLVGILLGLLYGGAGQDGSRSISNLGFYLVTIVYLAYTAMMPAVLAFPSEMQVLRKERFNNWYSLRTYYAAFTVAGTPLQVLFCTLYVCMSYFLSGQSFELARFLQFFGICLLVSFLAESIGLLLGSCLNQVNGTFIGAYSTALWIMLAGFLLFYDHTPPWLRWLHFTSYMHYAFEALAITQYGYPRKLLEEMSLTEGNFWPDVAILVSMVLVLRACAYWGLRRRLDSLTC